uniref:cytochrome c oxidase subunit 2 n=1 Tax=Austropallene cornigera TaxID=136200 RepID=UPI002264586D|nr:cytochrome c oxidase subunit 2 [Austropallene cornigera]UYX57765.1 cytochrome c oxidase subunit 2 [Austropallene cornigera]
MPTWNHVTFQDSANPTMEQLTFFHDYSMVWLTTILMFIMYMMIMSTKNKFTNLMINEGQSIETIWTILPAMILITMAIPSLRMLYLMEEMTNPQFTIKSIGHQWYWSYEYSDFNNPIEFDSYMIPAEETKNIRLLEVDNRLILPMKTQIRMLTTATDVIHSFTIPSMGMKMDSVPGRLNQMSMKSNRPGLFTGQCSEICGINHSFMPIVMEMVPMKSFINNFIKKNM